MVDVCVAWIAHIKLHNIITTLEWPSTCSRQQCSVGGCIQPNKLLRFLLETVNGSVSEDNYMHSGPSLKGHSHQRTPLIRTYSGPSLKGHSLERTLLYKGQFFAATVNACGAPSHKKTPL